MRHSGRVVLLPPSEEADLWFDEGQEKTYWSEKATDLEPDRASLFATLQLLVKIRHTNCYISIYEREKSHLNLLLHHFSD